MAQIDDYIYIKLGDVITMYVISPENLCQWNKFWIGAGFHEVYYSKIVCTMRLKFPLVIVFKHEKVYSRVYIYIYIYIYISVALMQRLSGDMNKLGALAYSVVFLHPLILLIVLRITLLAPGQFNDWPYIRVATLKWFQRSHEFEMDP